jgi:hypothetical protein
MCADKRAGSVSEDLSAALNHLAGIPLDRIHEAHQIQQQASVGRNPGEPHPLGIWFNGCYCEENGVSKDQTHMTYRLVACIA